MMKLKEALKLVGVDERETFVWSTRIAKEFGKKHENVMKAIDNLECSNKFKKEHFTIAVCASNRSGHCYCMTYGGYVFLVGGFTGKKASKSKEKFIVAFSVVTDAIRNDDQSKKYASIKRMCILYSGQYFNWRVLKATSEEMGLPPVETYSTEYGYVNGYHRDVWLDVYRLRVL